MRFLDVLTKHTIIHCHSDMQALFNLDDDGQISINFADSNDGSEFMYFDGDAEVILNPKNSSVFSVKDVDGDEVEFAAFIPAQLFEPQSDRDINLSDLRLELTEPHRLWVRVGKFDVLLNHTHEGLIVDVLPWVEADGPGYAGEVLATLCVGDEDADAAMGVGEDE